jgi:hypothetical protein
VVAGVVGEAGGVEADGPLSGWVPRAGTAPSGHRGSRGQGRRAML